MSLWPAGFIWLHYRKPEVRLRQYGQRALQRKAVHLRVARKQTNTQMKGPEKGLLKQNFIGKSVGWCFPGANT